MQYFFHNITERVTKGIFDIFDDIHIYRYDNNNNLTQDIKVPIIFGQKDKLYQFAEYNNSNIKHRNTKKLPLMSLMFTGMSKDTTKTTNKHNKIYIKNNDDIVSFYQYNGIPYKLTYDLHIGTLTLSDMFKIIEQIIPIFNPFYTLKLKLFNIDDINDNFNVPIFMNDPTFDIPNIENDKIRVITATIQLTANVFYYPIIKDAKMIEKCKLTLASYDKNLDFIDVDYEGNL